MRAKYTPRTNLRFVLWVFRPCRGLSVSQLRPMHRRYDTEENSTLFSSLSVCLRSRNSRNRFLGCKKRTHRDNGRNGDDVCRDTVLSRCQSCPMSKGRISYITSHARQENLYATYRTADNEFWSNLARESQQEFQRSGTEGKCIEARELIIALPEDLYAIRAAAGPRRTLRRSSAGGTVWSACPPSTTTSARQTIIST